MKKLIEYLFISSFIFTFVIASGFSVLTGPGGGIIDPSGQDSRIQQSEIDR